jgi:membrane-associated protease RseP (regulator of RpoE activity)
VPDPERLPVPPPEASGEPVLWRPDPRPYLITEPVDEHLERRRRRRVWIHAALFLLTILTTTAAGALQYASFLADFGARQPPLDFSLFLNGFWYSGTILAILGCHEMGHYLACRYYGVDASLPYFLPAPILTGTLGAFIRIREPIRTKRVLFDVGVAGPIAGFVVAVPALFLGLALSRVAALPPTFTGYSLGEPLLFKGAAWMIWGSQPDGYSINLHPMAFAAWFGLLATALNLFPIGQLDGGHISYSVLGRRSTWVTLAAVGGALVLTWFSSSWFVWTALVVLMLFLFGPRHPRTLDEDLPLDGGRMAVAIFALAMFVVCFTPAPIEFVELLPR